MEKARDFSYIQHKNGMPLELKGTMKRHVRPLSSNLITSNTVVVRNDLVSKIVENYQDLKSILPFDLENKKRKESVRVYDQPKNQKASGASYLMSRSQVVKDHPQKRHLVQKNAWDNVETGPTYKEKRHFQESYKETGKEDRKDPPIRKHTETLYKKLQNDLYSIVETRQNEANSTVKMSDRNMFKEGTKLGYEVAKEPKMSMAKRKEVMGTLLSSNPEPKLQSQRKSSFSLR